MLHTLSMVVFSRLIARDPSLAVKYKTVATVIPTSLRRYSGVSDDQVCVSVGAYPELHPLLEYDTFPWNIATDLTATLHRELPKTREVIGLLKYLFGAMEEWLRGKLGKKRERGLELSNLGPFPGPPASAGRPWTIEAAYFGHTNHVFGAAIKLGVVGNPRGGVGIMVTWDEQSIDGPFAEAFVAGIKGGLHEHLS